MARYPRPQQQLAEWAVRQAGVWQGATNIGLTEEQTALLGQRAGAFAAALKQHLAAEAAARSTRQKKDDVRAELRGLLTGLIAAIDTHASLTHDPSVYSRALLEAPGTPGTRPAPETPRIAEMRMNRAGQIQITIEATTGGSAIFEIERASQGLEGRTGPFEFVAATASKTHVDTGTPRGIAMAWYRVRTRLTNGKTSDWTPPHGVPYGPLRAAEPGAATQPAGEGERAA
ncbi:MAG: hypothetical protein RIE77_06845 [Phycisphaerales bacterium]|jgi:hypothetical protein